MESKLITTKSSQYAFFKFSLLNINITIIKCVSTNELINSWLSVNCSVLGDTLKESKTDYYIIKYFHSNKNFDR